MRWTDTRTPSAPAEGKRSIEGWSPSVRYLPAEEAEIRQAAAMIGVRPTTFCRDAGLAAARCVIAGLPSPQSIAATADFLASVEALTGDVTLQLRHFRQRLTGEAVAIAVEAEPELAAPQPVPKVSEAA